MDEEIDTRYSTPYQKAAMIGSQSTSQLNQGFLATSHVKPIEFSPSLTESSESCFSICRTETPSTPIVQSRGLTTVQVKPIEFSPNATYSDDTCSSFLPTETMGSSSASQKSFNDEEPHPSIFREHLTKFWEIQKNMKIYKLYPPPTLTENLNAVFSYNERIHFFWSSEKYYIIDRTRSKLEQFEVLNLMAVDITTDRRKILQRQKDLSMLNTLAEDLIKPLMVCQLGHLLEMLPCDSEKCKICTIPLVETEAYCCRPCTYSVCLKCRQDIT